MKYSLLWNWKSLSRSDSLWPHGLYSPWNSPGPNTGVGSHSLLQGIFPTQGSKPDILHCRQILYQLAEPPGKSRNTGVGGLSLLQGIFLSQESLLWVKPDLNLKFKASFNLNVGVVLIPMGKLHEFKVIFFIDFWFLQDCGSTRYDTNIIARPLLWFCRTLLQNRSVCKMVK